MLPGTQTDVKQCSLGNMNVVLVDLNTEDQDVITGMSSWINNIVNKYSVDGVSTDMVKHGKSPRAFLHHASVEPGGPI